jgi:L-glyceraldehyde 3-phosphate reductase
MAYQPSAARYAQPQLYARCGRSGLLLPRIALGLWHNFGAESDARAARKLVLGAFDRGITHFDLANNYGPPPGSAEGTLGSILAQDLRAYRDELIVSTKAGYDMWPGPYGDWGSRKYLLASLDQSLRRLGLEYVDIFYSHRPDPHTPIEETCGALAHAVRAGKALYVGLSNYDPEQTTRAAAILRDLGTPCLIHQPRYSLLDRRPEQGLLDVLLNEGIGAIVFSPLGQGLLSSRYLDGVPEDARAAKDPRFLKAEQVTPAAQERARRLNQLAEARGQTLAQMALAWVLRQPAVTSALVGASRVSQIEENLGAIANTHFDASELAAIDAAVGS